MITAGVKVCSRCSAPARVGKSVCVVHLRFRQMGYDARYRGLAEPTLAQLEELRERLNDMACPHCAKRMNWTRASGGNATVVTLQHYRSGAFGLICQSCNVRLAHVPGDTLNVLPVGMQCCLDCHVVLPHAAFGKDALRFNGKAGYCRECMRVRGRRYLAALRLAGAPA